MALFVPIVMRFAGLDTLHIRIILQPSPNLQRHVHFDGTRVRLLFRDPVFGQHIQDELWLYFQFTCQLVNSNHSLGARREFLSSNGILGRAFLALVGANASSQGGSLTS